MKKLVFESLDQYLNEENEEKNLTKDAPEEDKKESDKLDNFLEDFAENLSTEIVKKAKEIKQKNAKSETESESELDIKESLRQSRKQLNEGLMLMAVSAAFASPAMLKTIAKIVKYLSSKLNIKKGENVAAKIEKLSEKIHHAMKVPFEKLGKVFGIKDSNKNKFAELAVGFITLCLLITSGVGLTQAISHINTAHIASEGVLSALKSKELAELASKVAKSLSN